MLNLSEGKQLLKDKLKEEINYQQELNNTTVGTVRSNFDYDKLVDLAFEHVTNYYKPIVGIGTSPFKQNDTVNLAPNLKIGNVGDTE